MTRQKTVVLGVLLASALLVACADSQEPVSPLTRPVAARHEVVGQPAPTPLNTVTMPGVGSLTLWPYTGNNFSSAPVDPINLAFPGRTPMQVRAALMSLDGNRSTLAAALGLPALPAEFQPLASCTWKDAAGGGNQTAYSQAGGWAGSAIQLTCGVFQIRFHVRLFSAGDWTLGGAHFEVQISGLPNHESLSWDRAQQFVAYDLTRSGLLDSQLPVAPLPTGSQTPTYRTIMQPIYEGLPDVLKGFIGSVVDAGGVHIPNNGLALAFNLATVPAIVPMTADQDFTLQMGQVTPKPFCATSPYDYVYVTGPMHVTEHVEVTPSGNYSNSQRMEVELTVFQFDLGTMSVTGAPFQGIITDVNSGQITGGVQLVTDSTVQTMFPAAPGRGTQTSYLRVGPGNSSTYSANTVCAQ